MYLKRVLLFVNYCFHGNPPVPLTALFNEPTTSYNLPRCLVPRFEFLKKSLAYRGAVVWNLLSNDVRAEDNVNSFKRKVTKSNVLDYFILFDYFCFIISNCIVLYCK